VQQALFHFRKKSTLFYHGEKGNATKIRPGFQQKFLSVIFHDLGKIFSVSKGKPLVFFPV
jgi:hypothetical protein